MFFSYLNPCRHFQNTLAAWLCSLSCSQQKVCRYFCFPAFEEGLWHYVKSSDGSIPKTPPKEHNPGQSSADTFLHWDFSKPALHTLDLCTRPQICSPLWISYSFSFWCGVNSAAAWAAAASWLSASPWENLAWHLLHLQATQVGMACCPHETLCRAPFLHVSWFLFCTDPTARSPSMPGPLRALGLKVEVPMGLMQD